MKYMWPALLFGGITLICVCLIYKLDKKDPNLEKVEQGEMSRVYYQGHSYIVWGINVGGGCVHDPDCGCLKIKEKL